MKVFETKNIIRTYLFLVGLFLLLPSHNKILAEQIGCSMNEDSACENVDSFIECLSKCKNEGQSDCTPLESLCPTPKFIGCSKVSVKCAGTQGCAQVDFDGCTDVKYFQDENQSFKKISCLSSCGTGYFCQAFDTPCAGLTQRSCFKDGKCTDITAKDFSDAETQCKNLCGKSVCSTSAIGCPQKKKYGCFLKNGECFDNVADSFLDAQNQCKADCNGSNDCKASAEACKNQSINDPTSALYGTSLVALQNMATAKLNPGQLSDPKMLISRAINFLTGILGSITLLLYVVAGFMWMTARGASEQVDRAKKIMVWTTLGVVVMLFSYMLTTALFDFIPKLSL